MIGTAAAQERRRAALHVRGCTRPFGPLPLIGSRRSLATPACTAWVLRVGRREPARRCVDRGDAAIRVGVLVWWPVARPLVCRGAHPGRQHTARVPFPRRRPRSADGCCLLRCWRLLRPPLALSSVQLAVATAQRTADSTRGCSATPCRRALGPGDEGVISGRARVVSKPAPCPGALFLLSWVQETARSGEAAMKLACARESCNCHVASAVACRCVGRGALRVPLRAHGASHVLALTLAHARTCRNMARRWGASQTPLVRAARGLWSTTPEARRVDGVAHRTLAVLQVPLSLAHGTRARVVVCVQLRAPQ